MRIWHAKLRKNLGFQTLHGSRLTIGFMLEAEQMQITMHGEVREMVRKKFTLRRGLPRDSFESDHNIS